MHWRSDPQRFETPLSVRRCGPDITVTKIWSVMALLTIALLLAVVVFA